jgi:glycine betaine/proline transport system substrate-binding protein
MVRHHSLAEAGHCFRTGTETECFDRFELAVAERRWVIVPLWHPQHLHHRYRIRTLREPRGLLGGVDKATLIVRRDAEALLGQDALEELGSLHLGNNRVGALDDALRSGSKAGKDTPCRAE